VTDEDQTEFEHWT